MKILYVIPARGGSKGIPHKNIKPLNGKPLIYYSIDVARKMTTDENICVSTDDEEIINVVENYRLKVPFKRPNHLATDTATTNDVILHALNFFESKDIFYDLVVLLQPTSPFRNSSHVKEALELFEESVDMIVSVKESHCSSILCEEDKTGFLRMTLNKNGLRRQDSPKYYEYNGAIYIINVTRLKSLNLHNLKCIKKYLMDDVSSLDIDTQLDWKIAELFLKK